MTNLEALAAVGDLVDWFRASLDRGDDEETYARLHSMSVDWSVQPELDPIVSLLVKAWLERRPESVLARRLMLEHLGGLGRLDEGREVEAGQPPRPLIPHAEALAQHSARLVAVAPDWLKEK